MPTVKLRPGRLDLELTPGMDLVARLTFPAGELTGRTFAATIAGLTGTVGIAGTVMTITLAGTASADLELTRYSWSLNETTGGGSTPYITGRLLATDAPLDAVDTDAVVVVGDISVDVTVTAGVSGAALTAEATARAAADTTLQTNITAEATARAAADTAEATARAAAIAALSGTYLSFLQAAMNPDLLIVGTITRDTNGAATSAPVVWPDGTVGTFTADTVSSSFPGAVDAYHVTYGSPATRTYTQPLMTRDANGAVTARPAVVIS